MKERNHKEYESTPISIGGGISRKEDPRQSSSATEKSFVGDTSSTESSDEESKSSLSSTIVVFVNLDYDKNAIISSVAKRAHESMRRNDSARSSQECEDINDAGLRRNDSMRSIQRSESMRASREELHETRAESIRDDAS